MPLPVDKRKTISELLYREPFSPETERKRRNLIVISSVTILVTVYKIKVKELSWLDFNAETDSYILLGALSVMAVYAFLIFVFYAAIDIMRWRHADNLMLLHTYFDHILKGSANAYAIRQHIDKFAPEPKDGVLEKIDKAMNRALSWFSDLDAKTTKVEQIHRKLTIAQWCKVVVFEFSVPLFLGLVAISQSVSFLVPFLRELFK